MTVATLSRTDEALLQAWAQLVVYVATLPRLDVNKWPCELCGHGHYPGERCGANGCECRA